MEETLTVLLDLAIIFAIIGVSWQLMRLMSKATDTLDEFRTTNKKINVLIDKVSYDYEYISSLIKGVSATIERVNEEIFGPVRRIGNIFRTVEGMLSGLMGRFRPALEEEEDYLPEEE